jgi:L-amino acid N-acyltransferase YncA
MRRRPRTIASIGSNKAEEKKQPEEEHAARRIVDANRACRAASARAAPPVLFPARDWSHCGAMTHPMLRAATASDLPAIAAIYAHHVRTGLASFETEPPTLAAMTQRFESLADAGHPYLVAVHEGVVLGYAYAGAYRTRLAYRFTVEDSIYVAADATGRGIGRALLARLVAECEQRGYRQMLAVIGDSANVASIALHRACGFTLKCTLDAVGFKFGRWVDSVLMQRGLGAADRSLPAADRVRH